MGVQQYSLVAGDWINLEFIINDLARSVGQELSTLSTPEFVGLTLSGLTANSLIYPDSDGLLTSLGTATNGQIPIGSTGATPVLAEITGTANQITVTNGAGSITLSTPQDLDIGTDFQVGSLTTSGIIDASSGKILTEDNDTTAPTSESDGYVGVAKIAGNARIYFQVDGQLYYTSGSFDVAVQTGNPIGLLLCLTYA